VWVRVLQPPVVGALLAEREWADRILAGDDSAAAEFFNAHRDVVYRTARAITCNHEMALDLTQDTFVRAYQHLSSWHGRACLRTWLTRIAVRLAIDARRRAARYLQASEPEALSHDPRADMERSLLLARIRRLAMEVDGRPGVALRMRLFGGMSNREISEALDTTEANVRMQLSRALSQLRKRI
jgi:RNA polymerase sigma-70 factor (ECF subfamily)